METASSSETLLNILENARRQVPEDRNINDNKLSAFMVLKISLPCSQEIFT
jgi:hypothetical protein